MGGGGAGPGNKAEGGTITTPGDGYTYHKFTASGGFYVPPDSPLVEDTVEVLVVAGGGAGSAHGGYGAGGGAGGVRIFPEFPAWPTGLDAGVNYGIKIGVGGTGRYYDETFIPFMYPKSPYYVNPTDTNNPNSSYLILETNGEPSYMFDPKGSDWRAFGSTGGGQGDAILAPPFPGPLWNDAKFFLRACGGGSGGGSLSPYSTSYNQPQPGHGAAGGNIWNYDPREGHRGGGSGGPGGGGGGGAGEPGWAGGYGSWAATSPRQPPSYWGSGYGGNGITAPGWSSFSPDGYFGGGGGAGAGTSYPANYGAGAGGYGGGGVGKGPGTPAASGSARLNSGGGGGGSATAPYPSHIDWTGGDGGPGIVIVRYPA